MTHFHSKLGLNFAKSTIKPSRPRVWHCLLSALMAVQTQSSHGQGPMAEAQNVQ